MASKSDQAMSDRVNEVIEACAKVHLRIGEETATKLLAEYPGRKADSIAHEFFCRLDAEAFDEDDEWRRERDEYLETIVEDAFG